MIALEDGSLMEKMRDEKTMEKSASALRKSSFESCSRRRCAKKTRWAWKNARFIRT